MSDLKSPFRAWLTVGLLFVVGLLNYLDRNMIMTMRQSLVAAIPMTDAQFGLLTSIFLIIYGVLSPFAGYLADRFSRSWTIIISLFVWSAVTWLTAHARTYNELLTARALMGVSEACYIPAALALISQYHRGKTRSLATGVHMAGVMIGQGLGGWGGRFAENYSWTYPFMLFGAVGVGYAVLLLFTLRDAPKDDDDVVTGSAPTAAHAETVSLSDALRQLLSNKSFLLALAFFGLLGVAGWGLAGWLPTYLQERFHLSQGTAGISATVCLAIGSLTGVLLGGLLADYSSRTNPRGRILVPAVGLCFAAVGVLILGVSSAFWIAMGGLALYGVTRAFTDANMMPILCLLVDARYRATGYGMLNMVACLVGAVGIYAAGALRDAKFEMSNMLYFVVAAITLCAALLFCLKPKPQPE